MARRFTDSTLLIASNNKGKVEELQALLSSHPLKVVSAIDYPVAEPEETGATFMENAALKAAYYGKATGLPALADDSGLAVEGLDGAPGIYSARWAGPGKNFTQAMDRIEMELSARNSKNRRAAFVCALALWWPDGHIEALEGIIHGTLTFPARGQHGFGYDPIFIPEGYKETFGEMNGVEKNRISHRSIAFSGLINRCFS